MASAYDPQNSPRRGLKLLAQSGSSTSSSSLIERRHDGTTSEKFPSKQGISCLLEVAGPAVHSDSQAGTSRHYVLDSVGKTISTAGRRPKYGANCPLFKDAIVIGLGGGSASGKTTLANNIVKALDVSRVVLLSMDSFYREYDGAELERITNGTFNFDDPSVIDFDRIITTVTKLREGQNVEIPIYDFVKNRPEVTTRNVHGARVIIIEGIYAFFDKRLTDLMDIKIFVDTDADLRLARRLVRDIMERGRDLNGVLQQYDTFVKPSFQRYIAPTMAIADIILPRGGDNAIAVNIIVDHIKAQL